MPTDDPAASERPFPYLDFARRELLGWDSPENLGMSGVLLADETALGVEPAPPNPPTAARLREVIAGKYGLTPDHVHLCSGTSHANFAACLGLARDGRMAVERPAYEALPGIARAIGAACTRFERRPEAGWRIDEASLRDAAKDADLIVVSDLHNPSGRRLTDAEFALLESVATQEDAWVLVDEVYAAFDTVRSHPTAAARHPRFVTTNSLTKAWGFGDLRAGWILAAPEVARRIATWDDLVNPMLPSTCLRDASQVLSNDDGHLRTIRDRADARRDIVDAWIAATPGVSWVRPDAGITGLIRVGEGPEADQGERLAAAAAADGVRVVPGSFFQRPAWIRISYDLEPEVLERALAVLAHHAEALS